MNTKNTVILATLFAAASASGALDFSAFVHKAAISFPGYTAETTQADFPALVRLADGDGGFTHAACALAGGADVRFATTDGVELPSKVASWNPNGTSEFIVRIPELTDATQILVFWGNASAEPRSPAMTPFNPATYTLSWSFDEEGRATLDGTLQSRYGSGAGTKTANAGVIGAARAFDASSSQWVKTPYAPSQELKAQTTFTFEGWAKWESAPSTHAMIFGNTSANWNRGTGFGLMTNGKIGVRDGNGTSFQSADNITAASGEWHHLMISRDPVTKVCTAYVDGAQVWKKTNQTGTWDQSHDYYFSVAHGVISGWTGYFTGLIDEVRAQSVCRDGDYAAAVYANVADYANFVSIADATSAPFTPAAQAAETVAITVAAGTGGTVSPALSAEAVAKGTTIALTATPDDNTTAFYAWAGDCPTGLVFTASIDLPADRARSVTAIFAPASYVSASRGDDGTGDGSYATPYASINAAVSAIPAYPAVVLVEEGVYPLSYTSTTAKPSVGDVGSISGFSVALTNRVALRSIHGHGATSINCARRNDYGGVLLNSMGAVLDGFCVSNATANGGSWNIRGELVMNAAGHVQNCVFGEMSVNDTCNSAVVSYRGWIRDCLFSGFRKTGNSNNYSSPFFAMGGLVENCVFSNNTHSAGLRFKNAVARDCLFADNKVNSSNSNVGNGGGAYNAGDAIFENCTFMNNYAGYQGGGVYGGATLVNCAFGGNTTAQSANGPDFYGDVGMAHCLSAYATAVDGNIAGTPTVTDAEHGDYTPTGVSATKDHGAAALWQYEPGDVDVAGKARVYGAATDIGCFEYVPDGQEELAVSVSADAYTARDSITVTFAATILGAENVTYSWNFGDGTTSTEASPKHTYSAPGYYTVSLTVADAADPTRTASFPDGADMIKVMPSLCYVCAEGDSTPVEPYATPATAANDLYSAFLMSPDKILVGEGTIPIGGTVIVESPMEIRGADRESTKIKLSGGQYLGISNAGAVVADLTVFGRNTGDWNIGAVHFRANGLVTNCVIRDNTFSSGGNVCFHNEGQGGRLVGCIVANGKSNSGGRAGGIDIRRGNVLIENCIVTNNASHYSSGGTSPILGAGISVHSDSGNFSVKPVIRNCLVADNQIIDNNATAKGGHAGAGIYLARPAIVENCTIVTNSVSKSTAAAPGGLYVGSGSAITNCIVWGNSIAGAPSDIGYAEGATIAYGCAPELAGVATCTASDPCFKNPVAGDWTLGPGSPCRDAGARLPWMETALDLAGNRRRVGPPDLGCYESPAPAPLILFLQ